MWLLMLTTWPWFALSCHMIRETTSAGPYLNIAGKKCRRTTGMRRAMQQRKRSKTGVLRATENDRYACCKLIVTRFGISTFLRLSAKGTPLGTQRVVSYWEPIIGKCPMGVDWSRDRWRHSGDVITFSMPLDRVFVGNRRAFVMVSYSYMFCVYHVVHTDGWSRPYNVNNFDAEMAEYLEN